MHVHKTTFERNSSLLWTPFSYLADLDYANDLALLSHTHTHIQEKTQRLNTFAKLVGLNISSKKTEIMALNTTDARPVQIDDEELPCTDNLPILAATSVEMEELIWIFRAV